MNLAKRLLPIEEGQEENLGAFQQVVGWQKVDSSVNLDKIATCLCSTASKDSTRETDVNEEARIWRAAQKGLESHSLPVTIAHILNYEIVISNCVKALRAAQTGNRSAWDPVANEWLGMLAVFLLRDKLGLTISFDRQLLPFDEQQSVDLERIMGSRLRKAGWQPDAYSDSYNQPSCDRIQLTYLVLERNQKRYKFAVIDPLIGICPCKQYDPEAFAGVVDWYRVRNGKPDWTTLARYLFRERETNAISAKGRLFYHVLMKWLRKEDGGKRDDTQLKQAVEEVTRDIALRFGLTYEVSQVNITSTLEIDEGNEGFSRKTSPEILDLLKSCPKSNTPRDGEIWMDDVVIFPMTRTQADAMRTNFISSPVELPYPEVNQTKLYVMPPVKKKLYEHLKQLPDDGRSREPSFQTTLDVKRMELALILTFPEEDGGTSVKSRRYSLEQGHLWMLQALPYVSLWPNVELDPKHWGLYLMAKMDDNAPGLLNNALLNHITRMLPSETDRARWSLGYVDRSPQYLFAKEIHFHVEGAIEEDGVTVASKIPKEHKTLEPIAPWQLFESRTRPETITLTAQKGNRQLTIGTLELSRRNTQNGISVSRDRSVDVTLDFGTSSTMCFISDRNAGGARSILSGYSYLLDLIPDGGMDKEANIKRYDFERFCWIAPGELQNGRNVLGKINTIVQTDDPEADEAENRKFRPYIGGRYLRLNAPIWQRTSENTLDNFDVYSGLKFPEAGQSEDGSHTQHARFVFFANIITLAALDARMLGASKVDLRLSYPHDEALQNLSKYLLEARDDLNDNCFGGVYDEVVYNTEADAVLAYFKGPQNIQLNEDQGAVIMDIGGGTTDVVAVFGKDSCQSSFNIAGDFLVRRSMIYATAKEPGQKSTGQINRGNELRAMFSMPDNDKVKQAYLDRYFEIYEEKLGLIQNGFPLSDSDKKNTYADLAELLDSIMQETEPRYGAITRNETLMASENSRTPAGSIPCLAEVVKLRYLLLFYLVARYLEKNKKVFNYEEPTEGSSLVEMAEINIYLAGLGSRGLGFCCGKDVTDSSCGRSNFIQLLQQLVQIVLKTKKDVKFILPNTKEKIEVVRGLLEKDELQNSQKLTPNSAPKSGNKKTAAIDQAKFEEESQKVIEVFQSLFTQFKAENPMCGMFCDRFQNIWDKVSKAAKINGWDSSRQISTIMRESRAANLLGEMEYCGAAVWGFLRMLDFATVQWAETLK